MNIVLASASPRRKEILTNYNIHFDIVKSEIEEIVLESDMPVHAVVRLAFEKGMDVAKGNQDSLVIAADTIVVIDNEILGKPKDKSDAYKMLKRLSGKQHSVITGISLINLTEKKKIVDYVVSEVKFKQLSDSIINDYLSTGEFSDKAGAYGIQGYGALLVEEIKGDYLNIVGLPISRISDLLIEKFDINLFMECD